MEGFVVIVGMVMEGVVVKNGGLMSVMLVKL